MAGQALADVMTRLRRSQLLTPETLRELDDLQHEQHDPQALVRAVLKRGWLTAYQARELFSGRGEGLLLGEYVLLDRVGSGATSHVYKARHLPTGRTVGLKVLRTDLLSTEEAWDCLLREGRAGVRLAHPNLLKVHGALREGDAFFLVREFAEGTDLARVVGQQGPLPVGRACDYVRQASRGLQHAFERGLVHRDIKPSNLLLTDRALVKVLDLGIAAWGHPRQWVIRPRAIAAAGTPDYVAPERVEAPAQADVRSDVYGLGCTLYHLLAGRPPFPGGTREEKLLRHREEEPQALERLRPDVSPDLGDVVRRMMAKRPADRFPTPGAAGDALSPFAEAGPCDTQFVLELGDDSLASLDPGQSTDVLPDGS
ncbi:MAG: serine/threonine protein kinase [Planctomycetes bacterium]|nr:serine/threonine protein kinase [Planctomycetota bacterium]